MATIKVAGVGVDKNNPPSREVLIGLAQKTKQFHRVADDIALPQIEAAIDKSGLYGEAPKAAAADAKALPAADAKNATDAKPAADAKHAADTKGDAKDAAATK